MNGAHESGSVRIEGELASTLKENGVHGPEHGGRAIHLVGSGEGLELVRDRDVGSDEFEFLQAVEGSAHFPGRHLKTDVASSGSGFIQGSLMELRGERVSDRGPEHSEARGLFCSLVQP